MHKNVFIKHRFSFATIALLFAITLMTGCQKQVLRTPGAISGSPILQQQLELQKNAQKAFEKKDFRQAERLYDRLLQVPRLSPNDERIAWKRYALSAIANGHYHSGLEALENWLQHDESADSTAEWQHAWGKGVSQMPDRKAADLLEAVLSDPKRPWGMRAEAALLLAKQQWNDEDTSRAMLTLDEVYAQALNSKQRAALENRLFHTLGELEYHTLALLAGTLTPQNETQYPYAVILLEKARRASEDSHDWPLAWQALHRLQHVGGFADASLVDRVLAPLELRHGRPTKGIALALPLSGPYGNIGWKILRGAGIAQWQLTRQGHELDIVVINTDAPDWQERMKTLPKGYAVVGGPLRRSIYTALRQDDILTGRHLFTFLSSLPEGDEGNTAWRFFYSPKDEVNALISFAKNDLGIANIGALVPNEEFGERFHAIFSQLAEQQEITADFSAQYTPGQSTLWSGVLKKFLQVPEPLEYTTDSMPPEPPFQAVFLPDSWHNMELLIPNFFFHLEDRMVFLGSSLWGQGLAAQKSLDSRYYRLAVFPGAWNPYTSTPAADALKSLLAESGLGKPDLWVGIGYDFINFASRLGVEISDDNESVNAAIAGAQYMDWSIAPISWNADGLASQAMTLFQPSRNGFTPLNKERFITRLEEVRKRHTERVELMQQQYEQKRAEALGIPYEPPTPADTNNTISDTPVNEENL